MEWQPVNALPSSKETSVKVSKERSQSREIIKTRDQIMLLETAVNLCPSPRQANDFFAVFFLLLLWGV